jgi:predicted hydrocarbon binding protein
MPLSLPDHQLAALPRASLAALRGALLRDGGPDAAASLQEAGYAGGSAVYAAFGDWVAARATSAPEALDLADFERLASNFFREMGWGSLSVGSLQDAVATLDSDDWWEDEAAEGAAHPGSDFTVGVFASFFGEVAGEPLAVLQVEYRAAGAPRSRFLLGSPEVLEHVYERLADGAEYEAAVAGVE